MPSPERLLDSQLGITPAGYAASTTNGSAIDMKSARYAVILPCVGALASATITLHVEESADGSSGWTDVAGTTQTITTQSSAQPFGLIRMHGRERYLRVVQVITGTSAACGVLVIRFDDQYEQDFGTTFAYSV